MGCTSRSQKKLWKNRGAQLVNPDNSSNDNKTHPDPIDQKPPKPSARSSKGRKNLMKIRKSFANEFDANGDGFRDEKEMEEIVLKSFEAVLNNTEFVENGVYCSEKQMDEIVLKSLEALYSKVLSKLKDLGYDEDAAIKAVLKCGHVISYDDVYTNIIFHTLVYLETGKMAFGEYVDDGAQYLHNLEDLQKFFQKFLIRLLQENRPGLARVDALWCLLENCFHLGRAKAMELPHKQFQACVSTSSNEILESQDTIESLSSTLGELNLEDNFEELSEEEIDEMILRLVSQVEDLERQVAETKEWAQEKAIQAARKFSDDSKTLRNEREEVIRELETLEMEMGTLDESSSSRLKESWNDLREANCERDRANAKVSKLESENAEIRTEIECFELSISESRERLLELAKKEKKILKKAQARERQKDKLQEEIDAVREAILLKDQQLVAILVAQTEAEVRYEEEKKAIELALSQVEKEHCLKQEAEVNRKSRRKAIYQKSRIDLQSNKKDRDRLEKELAQLKGNQEGSHYELPDPELYSLDDSNERRCLFCLNDELSVVFLPCAHQVLCKDCNSYHEGIGGAFCPCCQVKIERIIHIFFASS